MEGNGERFTALDAIQFTVALADEFVDSAGVWSVESDCIHCAFQTAKENAIAKEKLQLLSGIFFAKHLLAPYSQQIDEAIGALIASGCADLIRGNLTVRPAIRQQFKDYWNEQRRKQPAIMKGIRKEIRAVRRALKFYLSMRMLD